MIRARLDLGVLVAIVLTLLTSSVSAAARPAREFALRP
jgi:hypothetical protein